MFNKIRFPVSRLTYALFVVSSMSSYALELEEIVVTAERKQESIKTLPVAVSAFSAETLQDAGISSAKDLQLVTPGLIFNNSGASMAPFIRGIGTRLSAPGLEQSIATYIDDRYIARAESINIDLSDIERVEVLKGPQGTFFGRNATGGAVRIITKDPTDEYEGGVKFSMGNYDYFQVSGVANIPLNEDLAVRVAVQKTSRDGFADNLVEEPGVPDKIDDEDNQNARIKLRWDINEKAVLKVGSSYYKRDETRGMDTVDLTPDGFNTPAVAGSLTGDSPDSVATRLAQPAQSEEYTADVELEVELDKFDFFTKTIYSKSENNVVALDADTTDMRITDVMVIRPHQSLSQEFRLSSDESDNISWTAGIFGYQEKSGDEVLIDAGLPFWLSLGDNEVETTSFAPFGQIEWALSNKSTMIIGARWTHEKKTTEIQSSSVVTPFVGLTLTPGLPYEDDSVWKEFTPRATFKYEFENVMTYVTYSRGFKSGGYNYPIVGQEVLDPEILDMLEIGAKGELMGGSVQYDTSIYYYDYSDLQVSRAQSGGTISTENAANAEIYGIDLNVDWLATENWRINFGLNMLDTKYQDYEAAAYIFVPAGGMTQQPYDADGEDMIRAADWSATLTSRYEIKLEGATVPLVLTYAYTDDYLFDFVVNSNSSMFRQDAYGVLNFRISFVPDAVDWEVGVWGKNITDEEYFDDVSGIGEGFGVRGSYASPLTFGVDFSSSF